MAGPSGRLITLVFMWTMVVLAVFSLEDTDMLRERARYHMRELRKTLTELDASSSGRIHKRSVSDPESCDEFLEYMQEKCPSFVETAIPKSIVSALRYLGDSKVPDPMLSRVTATRHGENLELEFEIIHSTKVVILKDRAFDNQKTFLDPPKEMQTTSGNADSMRPSRVTINYSLLDCRSANDIRIMPIDRIWNREIEIELDICPLKESLDEGEKTTQVSEIPMMKVVSDPGDTIFLEHGKDASIEMELRLNQVSEYKFSCLLWDWESNKLEDGNVDIELDPDGLDYESEDDLMSLEILDEKTVDLGGDGITAFTKDVKIRLTVKTGSRQLSGLLQLSHNYETKKMGRPFLEEMTSTRRIHLKFPYKITAFPLDFANLWTRGSRCGKNNKNTCIIVCEAFGPQIKSIFIIKVGTYAPPIRSTSNVFQGHSANIIQEVPMPTGDKEDKYRCVLILENGQIRSEIATVSGRPDDYRIH